MKIDILTLFPEMFVPLKTSILMRAQNSGKLEINLINIRDFSANKHHTVDDTPFGGGDGMVICCQPVFSAIESIITPNSKLIYMSPKGRTLKQSFVKEYLKYEHIIILCGHYEGVDQRILDYFNFEEISIGDYVLTGGELPAMVFVDAVSRYVYGVLNNSHSVEIESFSNNLLEYPQYTKPSVFRELKVPDVLLSGNHKEIEKWRNKKSLELTKKLRPDLLGGDYEN